MPRQGCSEPFGFVPRLTGVRSINGDHMIEDASKHQLKACTAMYRMVAELFCTVISAEDASATWQVQPQTLTLGV